MTQYEDLTEWYLSCVTLLTGTDAVLRLERVIRFLCYNTDGYRDNVKI